MRRFFYVSIIVVFMFVQGAAAGDTNPPDALEGHSMAGEPEDYSGEDMQGSVDSGRAALVEYFNLKMSPVEGTITSVDIPAGLITIRSDDGERTFSFDENTRFQQLLKQVEVTTLKPGVKVAGLYREMDGIQYLGRLVVTGAKVRRRGRR